MQHELLKAVLQFPDRFNWIQGNDPAKKQKPTDKKYD